MSRTYKTYDPTTGEEREFTTDEQCTELVLKMFDVAVQRLERKGISKEYMSKCYLNALVPAPKFIYDVVKDWLEGNISQEEAHSLASEEFQLLVEAWRNSPEKRRG